MINDVTVQKVDKENSWIAQTSVTSLCGGNHICDSDDDEYMCMHMVYCIVYDDDINQLIVLDNDEDAFDVWHCRHRRKGDKENILATKS